MAHMSKEEFNSLLEDDLVTVRTMKDLCSEFENLDNVRLSFVPSMWDTCGKTYRIRDIAYAYDGEKRYVDGIR